MIKNSEKALALLYREYLKRIKAGEKPDDAVDFSPSLRERIFTAEEFTDVEDYRRSLAKTGAIEDHVTGDLALTDEGLDYMESRFKRNLIAVTDFIAKFIP